MNSEHVICKLCGDKLFKKKIIEPTRLFAGITALAFITPFIMLVIAAYKETQKQDYSYPIKRTEMIRTNYLVKRMAYLGKLNMNEIPF